jgi:hypothetical protein
MRRGNFVDNSDFRCSGGNKIFLAGAGINHPLPESDFVVIWLELVRPLSAGR